MNNFSFYLPSYHRLIVTKHKSVGSRSAHKSDRKTFMNEKGKHQIIVSERLLEEFESPNGGWTKEALKRLGVPWPAPKDWKKQLIGTILPETARIVTPIDNMDFKCPRCNRIKRYVKKAAYKRAVEANKSCVLCNTEMYEAKKELDKLKLTEWLKAHPAIYNPIACELFDKLNKEFGWNLRHALNGGEHVVFCSTAYRLDAYDKDRGIIIEYDEPYHELKKTEDKERTNNIINKLAFDGCKELVVFRFSELEERFYLQAAIVDGERFRTWNIEKGDVPSSAYFDMLNSYFTRPSI